MDNNNFFGSGSSSSLTRDCLNFKVPKSNCYMRRPAERADRRSLVNIDNQPEESNANKLAAKAMKRKLEQADNSTKQQDVGSSIRYVVLDLAVHKKKDDDGDLHLAQKIMQNKQNTISGQVDDEYYFEVESLGKRGEEMITRLQKKLWQSVSALRRSDASFALRIQTDLDILLL